MLSPMPTVDHVEWRSFNFVEFSANIRNAFLSLCERRLPYESHKIMECLLDIMSQFGRAFDVR